MCFGKEKGISGGAQGPPAQDLSGAQPCQVETYSGYRVHERPRRFTWQGKWLEVRRIPRRWQEPEYLSFTVTATLGRCWPWRTSEARPRLGREKFLSLLFSSGSDRIAYL